MSVRSIKEKQRLRQLAEEKRRIVDGLRLFEQRGPKTWLGKPASGDLGVEIFDLKKDTEDGKLYRRNGTNSDWVELG